MNKVKRVPVLDCIHNRTLDLRLFINEAGEMIQFSCSSNVKLAEFLNELFPHLNDSNLKQSVEFFVTRKRNLCMNTLVADWIGKFVSLQEGKRRKGKKQKRGSSEQPEINASL